MFLNIINSSFLFLSAICFIISRLSFLLAMVLPWRVLAVAAGVDSAYSDYYNFYGQHSIKQQVIYLGATVVALFVVHITLDLLFDFIISKGAEKSIEKSNKSGVFNNYRVVAKRIYKYYATFFSASLYVVLAVGGLFYIYQSLLVVLFLYLFCSLLIIFLFYKFFYKKSINIDNWLSIFYKAWWHTGFILALIWVINDYWQGTMPDLLLTFFALILYRQLLVMMTVAANNGHQIYKNRVRAGQIFSLTSNASYQNKVELNTKFEKLVNNINEQKWLNDICKKYLPKANFSQFEKSCHLIEVGNVAYITVISEKNDGILVKLFNTNREALAEQEALLLSKVERNWPFVSLIKSKKINNYSVLVYHWPVGSQWLIESDRVRAEPGLREYLLACQLPTQVINQYEHSHAGLLSRLENVAWKSLQTYSGVNSEKVDWANIPNILKKMDLIISSMPKQLCLPAISSHMMMGSIDSPKIASASRWAWEPVGAAWPLRHLKQLDNALIKAAEKRDDLVSVNAEHAKIVARLYEFERRYRNKNYVGAVNVLSNLLNHFEKISNA